MRPTARRLLSLLSVLAPSAAAGELSDRIQAWFTGCHERGVFNGCVLVKHDGQQIYAQAFGLADPADGRALQVDTPFSLASVSKAFTCMAALLLVQDEQLSLDDPVTRWLPELSGMADGVSVRQLMHYTSGMPDHYELLGEVPAELTNDRVMETLTAHGQLDYPPGSQFSYSNGGYVVLARVLEAAAGKSLRDLLAARVFGPLGMAHTQVLDGSAPLPAERALGLGLGGTLDDYALTTTGAGGISSTVGDLARWDSALSDDTLLNADLLAQVFTSGRLDDGTVTSYGFGEDQLNNLGYAFISAGQLDLALAILRKNTDAFPDAYNTWDSLGEVERMLGDRAGALRHFSRSLELNSENDNARVRLADLEPAGR